MTLAPKSLKPYLIALICYKTHKFVVEELKVQQNEAIVKEANKTIENLKVANKLMAMEVEKLKVAFEDAQQRGDCYKKKFLK